MFRMTAVALFAASLLSASHSQAQTLTTQLPRVGTTSTTSGTISTSTTTSTTTTSTSQEHAMTGCVQKSTGLAGTYILQNTDAAGPKTIFIINPPFNLGTHLGHTITVRGTAVSSAELGSATKPPADHYMKMSTIPGALAMVSATCP